MTGRMARRKVAAQTNETIAAAVPDSVARQDRVFVITPRPPVTRLGGGVSLDLPSIDAIRANAAGADPDEVMADALEVIKEIREEDHRARQSQ